MTEECYHIPALLAESIDALQIKPDGTYIDATFGGGGHSRAIVERLAEGGHLYSFDQDDEAVRRAFADPRFTIVYGNFRYITNFMRYYGVDTVDGILADLGVSFHHFDDPERGFSFRFDAPLDMRMNRHATHTAAWILANYDVERLTSIFKIYGELPRAAAMARAIVSRRESGQPINTAAELTETVSRLINPRQEKKELAMLYQALRIEVNGEMEALEEMLRGTLRLLKPGARLAIITYHSLEDRMVKNFMRSGRIDGQVEKDFYGRTNAPLKLVTSKPITPSDEEISRNPRSRSAKLRVAVRI